MGLAAGLILAGRFELVRPLGTGASAEVWLARDQRLKEDVALKILKPAAAADPRLVQALEAECSRARRLVHPGILRLHDVHADGAWRFISMEAATGGDFGQLRGAGYRTIARALLPVTEALAYAHAQGVVHGDLKAGNVLRDAGGHYRLADFGIAAVLSRPAPGGPRGSLSGASPQQLAGEPPSPADDLYGLGSLLYDLLAGHPPFHPDITPERIRTEVPAPPAVDGAGESLPRPLLQLLAALLAKDPARRPAGLGAVRAVLEEVLTEIPAAVPIPSSPAPASARDVLPPLAPLPDRVGAHAGPSSWLLYGGLALLLGLAGAVLFVLPRVVSERGPILMAPAAPPAPDRAPVPGAGADVAGIAAATPAQEDLRARADAALAAWVRAGDRARAARLPVWATPEWESAEALAAQGDERYRARDFAGAAAAHEAAAERALVATASRSERLAARLQEGWEAFARGDSAGAAAAFEAALLIDPDSPEARRGRQRSGNLDEVIRLMAVAADKDAAGDLPGARAGYQKVLALDGEWIPAREALNRLAARAAAGEFETVMARGLEALAAGQTEAARRQFQRALELKPGDGTARNAMAQVEAEERRSRITALLAEGRTAAGSERWAEAAARFATALEVDGTLAEVREELGAARARATLDQRLAAALGRTDRLNDDNVAREAASLLAEGRAVASPGPRLTAQLDELAAAIDIASRPVPVVFESDNLTNVVIFRVGALGTFASRTVPLRPGAYTVVGTRDGYRDVRQTIRVGADGLPGPVVVRCEERI